MDDVINGRGVPIPVNVDPLGVNGGGNKSAADKAAGAAPVRGRLPEPGSVSASAAGAAAPATDNDATGADGASAGRAPARVPIPPTKPVVPKKASGP